ncbi:MAG: beta-galactosidase [Clostridia bacterium]|nr:beta-galactosidase [Clostridia bacterium]
MKNTVEIKKDGVYLNDEKFFLVSGDMHYFRILPEGWDRRLKLMNDFGLTAVTTYVPWNLTEPRPGEYCFQGRADLCRFLEAAQQNGLKVLLRCSPYLCGEWEMGGLPSWLLKDRTLCLRSSDPAYMEAANRYNKVLCDKIRPYLYTNGGPVILVGLENEYGSFGDDKEYLQMLCDFYRNENIDVPFISANGVDNFKYINGTLDDNWNGIDHCAHPDSLPQFEKLRELQPDKPLMSGEAWTGYIQFWGREFLKSTTGKYMAEYFREALRMGVCVNFYMFCGGTNFEFTSGALHSVGNTGYAPLMTSYDYDAPVSEEGTPTGKYFELRDVLDEYLEKEKRPHVNPLDYEAQEIKNIELTESAMLLDSIDNLSEKRVMANRTICMEDLDQDYGYICYKSQIRYTDPRVRYLYIEGLADRATVYIDGEYIGTQMRDAENNSEIKFTVKEGGSELTILVENMGRINYGYEMYDRKGILGAVRVKIQNPDGSFLYNYANNMRYTIDCLPLKSISSLEYKKGIELTDKPCFCKGTFDAKAGIDTFVDMAGWHKGNVWINGFNLGRYWEIGPQRTLYVPGELLKEKDNVIEILELHRPKADLTVSCPDHSLLCEKINNSLLSTDFMLL